GHSRLGEGFPERPRGLDRPSRRVPAESAQLGAQAVTGGDGQDLRVAAGASAAGLPAEEQRLRARQATGRERSYEHHQGTDAVASAMNCAATPGVTSRAPWLSPVPAR